VLTAKELYVSSLFSWQLENDLVPHAAGIEKYRLARPMLISRFFKRLTI
jgi:hypothetical protein